MEPGAPFLEILRSWYEENDPVCLTSRYAPVTRQTGPGSVAVATLVLISFSFANFPASPNVVSLIMSPTSTFACPKTWISCAIVWEWLNNGCVLDAETWFLKKRQEMGGL